MATQMTKSHLIEKISVDNELPKTAVKGVFEIPRDHWLQGTQEDGRLCRSWVREVRCYQEASHEGPQGHQSLQRRADDVQGQARAKDRQGATGEGGKRSGVRQSGDMLAGQRRDRSTSDALRAIVELSKDGKSIVGWSDNNRDLIHTMFFYLRMRPMTAAKT